MRTDIQTERQTHRQTDRLKLIVAFRKYANAPKNMSQSHFICKFAWTALGANHGLHVKKSAINSQSCGSRCRNGRDLQSMSLHFRYSTFTEVILDARCSVETAASILWAPLIPCRWRRQARPKHH